jgi:hypothetical protein
VRRCTSATSRARYTELRVPALITNVPSLMLVTSAAGRQRWKRHSDAPVVGHLEHVVTEVLHLTYTGAPGRPGADGEQADAETERPGHEFPY